MIIEKHPTAETAEQVYDFYESEDVELIDGSTGAVKRLVNTFRRSQLVDMKESLNSQLTEVDAKIAAIDNL